MALSIQGPQIRSEDSNAFWKKTPMDGAVQDFKNSCLKRNDRVSCLKFDVMNLLDVLFRKNAYKRITESGRSSTFDNWEDYIQSHDLLIQLPGGATLNLSPRNLDNDEIIGSLKLGQSSTQGEGRRNRLRKILTPVLTFVLLKATTLIPLFIGALGLKAWNALQLSFFAFAISVGLAVFQLCKRFAGDSGPPQMYAAPGGWDPSSARNMDSHDLAYRAFSTSS
ncbi:hypothetical protein C0J52_17084 [Blattella germanica]|nr:hypothetical protein C0J52_17084 [Blattella germanica]